MPDKIIQNIIRCKLCNTYAESRTVHDFRSCFCGAVHADGGTDYLKRGATAWENVEELSRVVDDAEYARLLELRKVTHA